MPLEITTSPLQALSIHYQAARERHPGEPLLIVFDIDGTLVPRPGDDAAQAGPAPFAAVVAAIRWFAAKPDTWVGLNTGRPESLRRETLDELAELSAAHGLAFHPHLLAMCPADWEGGVPEAKVAGMRYFQRMGYRIVAAVDDEPANLHAIDRSGVIAGGLLLSARAFRADARRPLAPVRGRAGVDMAYSVSPA